jgi:hypothetical protein
MFDFLRRLWNGPEVATASSPVFGKMRLLDFGDSQYWECEPEFDGRTISVAVNTENGAMPSDAQVEFYRRATQDIDALFELVHPNLGPAFAELYGPLPNDWRTAIEFCGIDIPIGGDAMNPWSVSFESVDDRKGLYSCNIEGGKPGSVGFDS